MRPEERADLETARDWVRGHCAPGTEQAFDSWERKLQVINAILTNGWIEPHETWKLQAIGISFGDALAQVLDLEWVVVDDEYGRSPALAVAGTSIRLFPQTMISKRIERGFTVDVYELFSATRRSLDDARANPEVS
jgi:hypothetical protein